MKDSSDVKLYHVCVHDSLKCWKQNEKNIHDLKNLISKRVYCISNWQNRVKTWEHNCVLIQKWLNNITDSLNMLNDWLPDQLQLIMSVTDSLQKDSWGKPIQYINTLVNLFKLLNKGCSHAVHNMIELSDWSEHVFKNSQFIENWRFYTMFTVIQSIHIVSASLKKKCINKNIIYYLNNFID